MNRWNETYGRTCRSRSGSPFWSSGRRGPSLCPPQSRCPRGWWRTPPRRWAWTWPCTAERQPPFTRQKNPPTISTITAPGGRRRTTESRADTRLVRISCRADATGTWRSPRELVLMPSHASFLIWAMPVWRQGRNQPPPEENTAQNWCLLYSYVYISVMNIETQFWIHVL